MLEALGALVPSIGVGLLFWYAVRAMVRADARERAAVAAMERADRARVEQEGPDREGPQRETAAREWREQEDAALAGGAPVIAADDEEHHPSRSDR